MLRKLQEPGEWGWGVVVGRGRLVFGIIRALLVFVGSGQVNAGQLVCNSTLELAFGGCSC